MDRLKREGKLECKICWFCDYPKKLVKFPCYHMICPECVEKRIFPSKNKSMIIKCPCENCKSSLDFKALKKSVTPKILEIVLNKNPELFQQRKPDLKEECKFFEENDVNINLAKKTEPRNFNSPNIENEKDVTSSTKKRDFLPEIKIDKQKMKFSVDDKHFESKVDEKISRMRESCSYYESSILIQNAEKGGQQKIKEHQTLEIEDVICSRKGVCFQKTCNIF